MPWQAVQWVVAHRTEPGENATGIAYRDAVSPTKPSAVHPASRVVQITAALAGPSFAKYSINLPAAVMAR